MGEITIAYDLMDRTLRELAEKVAGTLDTDVDAALETIAGRAWALARDADANRAEQHTTQLAEEHGWYPLGPRDFRHRTWFRWVNSAREEVHAIYDHAGRLEAWSVWRNRRTRTPDQEAGRRDRLNTYLTGGTP